MTKSLIRSARDGIRRFFPDRLMLTIDFLEYHHRFPRLNPPETFCEKIVYRKLYDRDPRLAVMADKILAKEQVADALGNEWTIPSLWVGDVLPPRSERNWPIPYVLKANHGSGWNVFVRTLEDQKWDAIEREAEDWLQTVYGQSKCEWLYSQIKPKLLVEPMIGSINESPIDYKFFVFGGRTQFVQVDLGRANVHEQFFFDLTWNRLKWEYICPWTERTVDQPKSFDQMVEAANRLGEGFSFVRVDFYEIGGKPLFGELTFYPNSGRNEFKPNEVELEIGRMWPYPGGI